MANTTMRKIDRIVVHCSATTPTMDIGVGTIRGWHVLERGWSDVGYHFVVTRDGQVQTGRPLERAGAHAKGFNKHSIGICYVGGLDKNFEPEDNRTDAQKIAMYELIKELEQRFNIAYIGGHCDLPKVTKACPCFDVQHWLYGIEENIKRDEARYLAKGESPEDIRRCTRRIAR